MKMLVFLALLPLTGCGHTLFVFNIGFTNKTAAGIGPPGLTAETYCMALTSPSFNARGIPFPRLTQEQIDFCHAIVVTAKK